MAPESNHTSATSGTRFIIPLPHTAHKNINSSTNGRCKLISPVSSRGTPTYETSITSASPTKSFLRFPIRSSILCPSVNPLPPAYAIQIGDSWLITRIFLPSYFCSISSIKFNMRLRTSCKFSPSGGRLVNISFIEEKNA